MLVFFVPFQESVNYALGLSQLSPVSLSKGIRHSLLCYAKLFRRSFLIPEPLIGSDHATLMIGPFASQYMS